MLLWLLEHVSGLAESVGAASTGDSRVYLTARIAAASLIAFAAAVVLGPLAIRFLRSRFRERIDSASARLNELHQAKQNTPTMGGLFICAAILVATLIFGDLANTYVQQGLFVTLSFAAVGAADDALKLRGGKRGLTARQKLLGQIVAATITVVWLYQVQRQQPAGLELVFPLGRGHWFLGAAFIPWGLFLLVGSSNGVNLTDGLDGLAAGCVIFAGAAFTALTYLAGHRAFADYLSMPYVAGAGELAVLLGAMVGAVLGFLWYNCHPAAVFMGDTGSLPLGALLALAALAARQELLLAIIGGVFVIETLSVILQVGCYKLTGRRVLACSPLHNHYVFRGVHEIKIVTRFWIVSALLAILGVASLKLQ